MVNISLRYDLRLPPFAPGTHGERYRACLEQSVWGDGLGVGTVTLCEHHGIDDGFMSAPLTVAAAVAGMTKHIRLTVAAALVTLHDPIRFAEQCAAIQLISNNRLLLVAGMGYRQEEFDMAGVNRKKRGTILEENVLAMLKAWTGEPFEYNGRTVVATPRPEQPPMVFIGGSTPRAARRAAKLGLGFFPSIDDPELFEIYRSECEARGIPAGATVVPGGPGFVHVSNDPERDWQRIMPYALHEAKSYDSWQVAGQRSTVHVDAKTREELRANGSYRVVTPKECIELARQDGRLTLHPLMGGLPPEIGWEGLRLFEKEVRPHLS